MATAPSGRAPQLRTHTCPGTRLGLPGDARNPAGNEPELARLHGSLPVASLAGAPVSPGRRPTAVGSPPLLTRSSLPSRVQHARSGPGVARAARTPAPRQSALTLLAVPFWRLPFGGDVPRPTSQQRRPADLPWTCEREGGRPRPPL